MKSPVGLAKIKQQEFFFASLFVVHLAYAYHHSYVAGLTSFLVNQTLKKSILCWIFH